MSLFDKAINKKLYTYSIRNILNEMAKKIDHRTLDRKLLLSVASVCSRNKATECEFVKPMKKLTKQDLMERYVAALIIMKKPCPKTERDMDKIKVFNLFGHRILELGGTISEIQDLYNINMGITSNTKPIQSTHVVQSEPDIVKPVRKPHTTSTRSKVSKKYITKLETLIQHIPTSLYDDSDVKSVSYVSEYNKVYKKCHNDIESYVNSLLKKCHNDAIKFVDLLRDDIINFNKLTGFSDKHLFAIRKNVGYVRRGYDGYDQYFNLEIDPDSYNCFVEYEAASFAPDARRRDFKRDFELTNLFKYPLTSYSYFNEKPNLFKVLCEGVYLYIVKPYILYKLNGNESENAANSEKTLLKYKMETNPSNYFQWFKSQIKTILENNPDKKIYCNYNDWSGAIKDLYYNSSNGKCFIHVYMQSGSSDRDSTDTLNHLTSLSASDEYEFTYTDRTYSGYHEDAYYSCVVSDLDTFAEKVFNIIKEDIQKGKLV